MNPKSIFNLGQEATNKRITCVVSGAHPFLYGKNADEYVCCILQTITDKYPIVMGPPIPNMLPSL